MVGLGVRREEQGASPLPGLRGSSRLRRTRVSIRLCQDHCAHHLLIDHKKGVPEASPNYMLSFLVLLYYTLEEDIPHFYIFKENIAMYLPGNDVYMEHFQENICFFKSRKAYCPH